MINKFKYILIIGFLYFSSISIIYAQENLNLIDFNKKGNLEITLIDNESDAVKDVNISLYYVAKAVKKNNNLSFEYLEEFNNCNVSLDKLNDNNVSNEIFGCINDEMYSIDKKTDIDGTVKYNNLELGLYLVVQNIKKEGHSNIEPFLVTIPRSEDSKWVYNIESLPKTEIYKEIDLKVIKKWNTTRLNILPSSVKINLYKDDILVDTVILNDDNNWEYVWEELEKSDSYNVKEIDIPDGYTVSYEKDEYTFIVTNTDTLAQTGQIYYPIMIFLILGIMLIFVGIYMNKCDMNE